MLEVFKHLGMQKINSILIFIGLLALDQATKLAFTNKNYGVIHYQTNYGAAFSILQGYRWLFIIIAAIVMIGLIVYYKHAEKKLPVILIMAGTAGNAIDRIFLGYVRDFIDLRVWPVFNVADSLNLIGAILLTYYLFKK
jgi:signal peptidase II